MLIKLIKILPQAPRALYRAKPYMFCITRQTLDNWVKQVCKTPVLIYILYLFFKTRLTGFNRVKFIPNKKKNNVIVLVFGSGKKIKRRILEMFNACS